MSLKSLAYSALFSLQLAASMVCATKPCPGSYKLYTYTPTRIAHGPHNKGERCFSIEVVEKVLIQDDWSIQRKPDGSCPPPATCNFDAHKYDIKAFKDALLLEVGHNKDGSDMVTHNGGFVWKLPIFSSSVPVEKQYKSTFCIGYNLDGGSQQYASMDVHTATSNSAPCAKSHHLR